MNPKSFRLHVLARLFHSNTENDVYVSTELSKLKYSIPEFIKSNLDLSKKISSISPADKKISLSASPEVRQSTKNHKLIFKFMQQHDSAARF